MVGPRHYCEQSQILVARRQLKYFANRFVSLDNLAYLSKQMAMLKQILDIHLDLSRHKAAPV